MVSNFTSGKGGYKKIGNFSHHCNKVLPLVYDDSLSYYEVLCKVVRYLNDVIDNLNSIGENDSELRQVVEEHIAKAVQEIEYLKNKVGATVSVDSQHFSAEQQAQARANIGACAFSELADKLCRSFTLGGSVVSCETTEGFPLHVVSHLRENNSVSIPLDGEWNFDDVFPCLYLPKLEDGEYVLRTNCAMIPVHLESRLVSGGATSNWAAITPIDDEGNPDFGFTMDTFSFKPHPDCVYRLTYIYENGEFTHKEVLDTLDLRLERIGHTSIKLTQKNGKTEYVRDVEFDDTVDGGYYDWSTGVLTDSNGDTRNFAPCEITALAGTNTIYSDSGDTDVSGWTYADNVVLYTPQKLNDEQKAQARENIGAVSVGDVGGGVDEKALVEKFAPTFKKTGSTVTCNPVEGHPLEVVSYITSGTKEYLPEETEWSMDYTGNPAVRLNLPAGEYELYAETESVSFSVFREDDNTRLFLPEEGVNFEYDVEGPVTVAKVSGTFVHDGGWVIIDNDSWTNFNVISLKSDVKSHTSVSLTHNGETINTELPRAVADGTFNWSTGLLIDGTGIHNLIAVDLKDPNNWGADHLSQFADNSYTQDLPNGTYTIYAEMQGNGGVIDIYKNDWGIWIYLDTVYSGLTSTFEVFMDEELSTQICLVKSGEINYVKLEAGSTLTELPVKNQLAPHEILGLSGANTLNSSTGNTMVSGRANPVAIINSLEQRLETLEAEIANKE